MLNYSFSKQKRLLTANDFKAVLSMSKAKFSNEAVVIYALQNTKPCLGLAIAKKHLKKAVERNNVKRVVRESFRLNYATLPNAAVVILSRATLTKLSKQEVRSKIEAIWQQLRKRFPLSSAIV